VIDDFKSITTKGTKSHESDQEVAPEINRFKKQKRTGFFRPKHLIMGHDSESAVPPSFFST
jgi:hypothetical protein